MIFSDCLFSRAVKDESLKDLCSSSLKKFEQCLDHDDQAVGENSTLLVSNIFSPSSEENPAGSSGLGNLLLPPDLVLKLTALSILPSYSLRQLGMHDQMLRGCCIQTLHNISGNAI